MTRIFGLLADIRGCAFWRIQNYMQFSKHQCAFSIALDDVAAVQPDVLIGARVSQEASWIWQGLAAGQTWFMSAKSPYTVEFDKIPKLVYEVDDAFLHVTPHQGELTYKVYSDPIVRKCHTENLRVSDAVTVSTEPLATEVRQYTDAPVYITPNLIDPVIFEYEPVDQLLPCTIGYGGGDSHAYDLDSIYLALDKVLTRFPSVKYRVNGLIHVRPAWTDRGQVEFKYGTSSVINYQVGLNFSIGIAPLEYSEFNEMKSPIKAIELGARGIPCIATDMVTYRDVIIDGVTGFLVPPGADHLWVKYLTMLIKDRQLRETMGAAAREHIKKNYTMTPDRVADWDAVMTEIAGV
jgi:glycosyltransferase involved in cell wall biosynthesis